MKKTARLGLLVLLFAAPCSAGPITFDYSLAFTGAQPGGQGPWLSATFNDTSINGIDGVLLTIVAGGLVGNEFVTRWGFNLDPGSRPARSAVPRRSECAVDRRSGH